MIKVLQLCQLLNLKYQQVKDYYIEFMAKLFPFSQITIWNCRWNIRWCSWNTWIHIATTRGFGTSRVSLGSVPMVSSIKSRLLKREFMFLCKHILGKQDSITSSFIIGPVKVNQKMAFFVFEMDFFSGFQIQFVLEPGNWKPEFWNP